MSGDWGKGEGDCRTEFLLSLAAIVGIFVLVIVLVVVTA